MDSVYKYSEVYRMFVCVQYMYTELYLYRDSGCNKMSIYSRRWALFKIKNLFLAFFSVWLSNVCCSYCYRILSVEGGYNVNVTCRMPLIWIPIEMWVFNYYFSYLEQSTLLHYSISSPGIFPSIEVKHKGFRCTYSCGLFGSRFKRKRKKQQQQSSGVSTVQCWNLRRKMPSKKVGSLGEN